jgi:cytochrome subunit of sulfide dehydrogenase
MGTSTLPLRLCAGQPFRYIAGLSQFNGDKMRHLKKSASLLVLLCATSTQAQDNATLRIKSLAATCAACHGTNGRAVEAAAVPGLAGLPAAYMVEQMKAFKNGSRPATVMHQLAKGYSDTQIEQLAAYFAAQSANRAR